MGPQGMFERGAGLSRLCRLKSTDLLRLTNRATTIKMTTEAGSQNQGAYRHRLLRRPDAAGGLFLFPR